MKRQSDSEGRIPVLVVEDDYKLAKLCAAMVEEIGYQPVGPVPSLEKARALLNETAVQAALLDVRLRDGLAFELVDDLRAGNVPFVFCTGYEDDELFPADLLESSRLVKPFSPVQLQNALRSAIA
jgi:DNA-binding response OmpR family regulator